MQGHKEVEDTFNEGLRNVVAQIEANGPRDITAVTTEVVAARSGLARSKEVGAARSGYLDSPDQFKKAQEIFHRHLTSIPEDFDGPLAELPEQFQDGHAFSMARLELPMVSMVAESSDVLADALFDVGWSLPRTLFLFFDIGRQYSVVCALRPDGSRVFVKALEGVTHGTFTGASCQLSNLSGRDR